MKEIPEKRGVRRGALVKAVILLGFIIGSICLYRLTPIRGFLTPEVLDRFLEAFGFWAPLVFILFEAAGICLFVPASILVVLGAAIFGTHLGFIYGWIGAMVGASGAFFIGRTLGRDLVESFMGGRLKKYDDAIERNGFATVLYIRLLNSPFTPMNFGIALTRVHFRDFFFGTALGVLVSLFALTFVGGVLKEVWVSGRWEGLVSPKVFLAVALFIFSAFLPKIIKKLKGEALSAGH